MRVTHANGTVLRCVSMDVTMHDVPQCTDTDVGESTMSAYILHACTVTYR